ncbi:topoisomerase II [Pseudomonas fluorescens]|uniref:Topoisomerase II n=1 Tax=Pseudomonas fluorescens TaxID=294 RepID=A0A448DUI1_PSEFL|nr:DUF2790 domain-containing protein [Pseudomonas fluorescens]VEF10459.1 topoisomerase II [Pseudomonas fluorescens]
MTNKSVIAACLFAALNICTLSAHAEADVSRQTYSYGTHLDIKKVISMTEDDSVVCGITQARMVYLDSAGKTRELDYSKFADGCNNQN